MTNVNLPTHAVLTAATVKTIDINGAWSNLHYVLDPGSDIAYVRNDGTNPVTTPADQNYVVLPSPADWECIPSSPTDLTTTTVRIKSTGTPTVHIKQCDCDD